MQIAVKEEAECVAVSGENTDAKRPLIIRRRVCRYLFCIPVLVQGSQLYEWAFRVGFPPPIEFQDYPMHGKEQIVIRLLKRLCNRVKFAFVATAVIRLRLARHRADEVRVYAHREADHVHGLLNVGAPIAALFSIVNTRYAHIVLFLPVR